MRDDPLARSLTDQQFPRYGGSTSAFPGEPRNLYTRLVFRL